MNEHKTVVWFADERKANTFFFQSPFRSWKFLVNTAVLTALLSGLLIVLFRNLSNWSSGTIVFWIGFLIMQGAFYPYVRVHQSHRKIYELYVAGRITEQPGESALNQQRSAAGIGEEADWRARNEVHGGQIYSGEQDGFTARVLAVCAQSANVGGNYRN